MRFPWERKWLYASSIQMNEWNKSRRFLISKLLGHGFRDIHLSHSIIKKNRNNLLPSRERVSPTTMLKLNRIKCSTGTAKGIN